MNKLDLRTCVVMLAIFAVGYATALALHPPAALALGDRIEVEELVADRIIARESIESEVHIYARDGIYSGNWIHGLNTIAEGWMMVYGAYYSGPIVIVDASRNLTHVSIAPDVTGGIGLDVGKLGGHPATDYVLWSDLESVPVSGVLIR